ncbi:MAG: hypothetical protein IJY02_06650 [Oscillospiraceae bacterium]|nr:hypothetical protein [Oscillospiraceae bacterium]
MNFVIYILSVFGVFAIHWFAFICGAVFEDIQILKAGKEGRPYKLGNQLVRIIPWREEQGAP